MTEMASTTKQASPVSYGSLSPNGPHSSYAIVREKWRDSENKAIVSLREFVTSGDGALHIHFEHLVELLGDAQRDPSDFGRWVFDEAAQILAHVAADSSFIDNNDWSHAASYLFRAACFAPTPLRSVLDGIDSHPHAEALLSRAVEFCESSHSLGTLPVLIRGIIASNLRAWAERGDISSFYFRPEVLRSPTFVGLLEHARIQEQEKRDSGPLARVPSKTLTAPHLLNERFCIADSPQDVLLWMFARDISFPVPSVASVLKELLCARLGDEVKMYPFLAGGVKEIGPLNAPAPVNGAPAQSREHRAGIYVDVFGTLIGHDGQPNLRLVQLIQDLMSANPPRPVFLVSDSQDEELAHAFGSIVGGLPPVIHKDTLQLCQIECLVDNCEPEPQGLHADRYLTPAEAPGVISKLIR